MAIVGGAAITGAATLGAAAMSKGGGGGQSFKPMSIGAPGLHAAAGDDFVSVTRRGTTTDAMGRLRSLTDQQSGELTNLLGLVKPGMSQLRNARLAAVENARNRSIGNLSENLQRRRVLGSSFAQDALGRVDREFGQAAAEEEATSFLQELDATTKLLEQRFQTNLESVMTEINQSNFEADLGARLSGAMSSAMTANNSINAQLAMSRAQLSAQNTAGFGKFFEPVGNALGEKFFGGGTDLGGGFMIDNSGGANLAGGSFLGQ